MPVQVFVDDSGGKGQGGQFVLAGLLAHAERWAWFSDEWQACLDKSPRIRCFKMREAAVCGGDFHGFSEAERDARLREFAGIINRHSHIGIYSVIDLAAHSETWAVDLVKPFSEPYFYPFQNMILASGLELSDLGLKERFEIIFDEQVIFGPRVKAWYPLLRDIAKIREPQAHSVLPVEPMFKSDEEFLPLQACDLVAWCVRKGGHYQKAEDHPFHWLLPELPSLRWSEHSQFYNRERLQSVLDIGKDELEKMKAGDTTFIEVFERHKDLFGLHPR